MTIFTFSQTLRIKHVYVNVCFVCEMKYSISLHVLASNFVCEWIKEMLSSFAHPHAISNVSDFFFCRTQNKILWRTVFVHKMKVKTTFDPIDFYCMYKKHWHSTNYFQLFSTDERKLGSVRLKGEQMTELAFFGWTILLTNC